MAVLPVRDELVSGSAIALPYESEASPGDAFRGGAQRNQVRRVESGRDQLAGRLWTHCARELDEQSGDIDGECVC